MVFSLFEQSLQPRRSYETPSVWNLLDCKNIFCCFCYRKITRSHVCTFSAYLHTGRCRRIAEVIGGFHRENWRKMKSEIETHGSAWNLLEKSTECNKKRCPQKHRKPTVILFTRAVYSLICLLQLSLMKTNSLKSDQAYTLMSLYIKELFTLFINFLKISLL